MKRWCSRTFSYQIYRTEALFIGRRGEYNSGTYRSIINKAAELGVKETVIGMAHRGRLNVLSNILGKTYEQIFTEFEGNVNPDLTMGDGDVKYHLGYASYIDTPSKNKIYVKLNAQSFAPRSG
jgi:2-oxoglutarate dehydrogenase E1 component